MTIYTVEYQIKGSDIWLTYRDDYPDFVSAEMSANGLRLSKRDCRIRICCELPSLAPRKSEVAP